jgi:hypothetical protein
MNMNEEFEAILETCTEDIAEGEASLQDCLIRYPHYAAEMEPILLTATYLHNAKDDVRPSPFLRGRIRAELKFAVKDAAQKRHIPLFFWRMALNVAVLVSALVMTNTVFAQGALPGESLYKWKLTSEHIWRIVSVDPLGTDLKLSDRRLTEYVAVSNDESRRARVLTDYNELLARFKAEEDEYDRARIVLALKSQQASLRNVGLSLPELDSYFSGPESQITDPSP